MDWLRLFALLIAVASVQILAEGPKKKIRIHLPQKVKHIHHHKKIYITNHPASAQSQYAPAYLPNAEGGLAVPSNVGLPAVAGLLPINSLELYDEAQSRPGNAPAASKLLPLYRARGYYGPNPSEWDDDDYDQNTGPDSDSSYASNDYIAPPAAPPSPPPKRVKIIKINNDAPRKKVNRKQKPKRVPTRSRPRPEPEEEHPVSSFHEQFYSDVDGSGAIRKIKKPPRVEKIIDGDTEHIHTYSEEHIHKVFYDDGNKLPPGVVGVDHVGSMSALNSPRPLIPLNNPQTLFAIPPEALSGFAAVGTPSQLEFAGYNPREVTHDHIFHDHGEIPAGIDFNKDSLSLPPKVSYNSQGVRLNGNNPKRPKIKNSNKYSKPQKQAGNDYSYYENAYGYGGQKKIQKPKIPQYDSQSEQVEDYRPIPSFKLIGKNKPRLYGHGAGDFRQANPQNPFSVQSTIVHDYQPKSFPGALPPTGFSKFKDPFVNFKETYTNNFEYDTFASSSNIHTSQDRNDSSLLSLPGVKGKKKSVSTQNVRFGGKDHQTNVDHLNEAPVALELNEDDGTPTALENFSSFDEQKSPEAPKSTPFTIKESSPVHPYYSAMAIKAMMNTGPGSEAEASNTNFQYVQAPAESTTLAASSVATTISTPSEFSEGKDSNKESTEAPKYIPEPEKRRKRVKNSNKMNGEHRQRYPVIMDYKSDDRPVMPRKPHHLLDSAVDTNLRGELKYGDKI